MPGDESGGFLQPLGMNQYQALMAPPGSARRPQIEVVEPLEGWWQSGSFGFRTRVRFPQAENVFIAESLELPNAPGPPRPLTINLYRSDAQNIAATEATYNYDLVAVINAGVSRASFKFEVDVHEGMQLSIVASRLTINFRSFRPNAALPYVPPEGGTVMVGATIGLGAANSSRPPTLTTSVFELENGDTQVFEVPSFARAFTLLQGTDEASLDGLVVMLIGHTGFVLNTYRLSDVGPALYSGLLVPGTCGAVHIVNDSGSTQSIGILWQLGL